MTLKKKPTPRSYETFPSSSERSESSNTSNSDKSRISAGIEAQRLASQGLWSDNYINRTPLSTASEMGTATEAFSRDEDPADPPPIYTPSETTADQSSTPPSPVIARSQAQPVREPRSPSEDVTYPAIPEEEPQEETPSSGTYASSPLLERAQPEPEAVPQRCSHWGKEEHRNRRRRFRKACWFSCALALCLWLMLPALIGDRAGTRGPHWHHRPSNGMDHSPLPAWPNPKREYRQHETSSSISGTFKLYDLLDLSTSSGSININVEPQPGDKPAVMKLSTKSGSIRVNMGKGIIPWLPWSDETNRTFETTISAKSGSIGGSIVAGNGGLTTIETASGSIRLTVHALDLGPKAKTSRLETISGSGSQTLTVASSSSHDLCSLEAKHLVRGSASLKVDYPKRWMGKLHMRSIGSGSTRASGSGLEFEQDGNREKYAWRGDGDLKEVDIVVEGSGSASFTC